MLLVEAVLLLLPDPAEVDRHGHDAQQRQRRLRRQRHPFRRVGLYLLEDQAVDVAHLMAEGREEERAGDEADGVAERVGGERDLGQRCAQAPRSSARHNSSIGLVRAQTA